MYEIRLLSERPSLVLRSVNFSSMAIGIVAVTRFGARPAYCTLGEVE